MREKQLQAVFAFHTTAAAMAAEKVLKENRIAGRLIPVPRQMSAGCGIACICSPKEKDTFARDLKTKGIEVESCMELML